MKRAVTLLSGGLDSATAMAVARQRGYSLYALSFDYGQRHAIELERANRVAVVMGAEQHRVMRVDLAAFGGSALTDASEVPKSDDPNAPATDDIPITYVPARNTIFLSMALAYAETIGTGDIFIGVNALDYSGYPDCRPEYIAAFQTMANLATKGAVQGSAKVTIHAPLIDMSKKQIIETGLKLGVDYSLTWSCYDPAAGRPCGRCESCRLRAKGFADAGIADPA